MIERPLNKSELMELEKITNLLENKKYHEAYQLLERFKEYNINIIHVFKAFCLIKLENFQIAYKETNKIKYEKDLQPFLTPLYYLYNKPINFNINNSTNIYQRYLYSILNNDYELMLTTKFKKHKEIETFTFILMTLNKQKIGESFLIKKLKENPFDFSLFYLLISNSLCIDIIFNILEDSFIIKNNKIIYYNIKKRNDLLSDRFLIISIIYY